MSIFVIVLSLSSAVCTYNITRCAWLITICRARYLTSDLRPPVGAPAADATSALPVCNRSKPPIEPDTLTETTALYLQQQEWAISVGGGTCLSCPPRRLRRHYSAVISLCTWLVVC